MEITCELLVLELEIAQNGHAEDRGQCAGEEVNYIQHTNL